MRFCICAVSLAGVAPALTAAASLASLALDKVLHDAEPIFGTYVRETRGSKATWMKRYADDTPLVRMNIPGTHDAATWNYSQATQDALRGVTDLNGVTPFAPVYYRCQNASLAAMLDGGIRAFDLRYALDPTNTSLVFYHGPALQSQTATVPDVLFGFYRWLADHPSEALFLSFQHEGSTAVHASNDAATQRALYDALTDAAARRFFVQAKDRLGTLGEARGKITLLRRFDLDRLPAAYEAALPGLHLSPSAWTDNGPDIAIVYNAADNSTAYVEDYYEPQTPQGSDLAENVRWKYNATVAHLEKAVLPAHRDALFWTWASSNNDDNTPPDYPVMMALGNGSAISPDGGVNNQLVPFFKKLQGQRLGIVMFDYFQEPSDLIDTFLSL